MAERALASYARPRGPAADAALAVIVVAVVALMVVPLPTWLLDVLLASNLAVSVTILLVTLYVGSALRLTTFPTLLLVTTLVRVALNVSSTRLILLHADAGEVIRAFGSFVVSGNFVVGGVIFLIVTVIQFVVVARGSERVAEVAARFTLDALPGKQMAIDAELRAGTLDAERAHERRRRLEQESQFYGAMDGAVKYVKGDVIATLVIAIINLVGGVAIGVGQRGLELGTALRRYGLLTIGDGLVTQIPALLIATAAGILVTRVPSSDDDLALGAELAGQVFGVPRALGAAGAVVTLLAMVPGLPAVPFLAIGAVLFVASRLGAGRAVPAEDAAPLVPAARGATAGFVPQVVPWSLDLSHDISGALRRGLTAVPERLRARVFRELGVPLPPCRLGTDPTLPDAHAVLSIREVPARIIDLGPGAGHDAVERVESELAALLLDRAADFLGIAETRALLDRLETIAPGTVRHVVPKTVDVAVLSDVLRRLAAEGVSIRDLRAILEALGRSPEGERDAAALTEQVRAGLRRAITWELTGGSGELGAVVLDVGIEDTVRSAVTRTSAGSFLALSPAASRELVEAIRAAVLAADPPFPAAPVILTRPDIRRFVRELLEPDLSDARIVSYPELLPEIVIKPRARATLAGR